MTDTIYVLDHGHVKLVDQMGTDLSIVNNARQSFGQESVELGDKEKGLINFLMKNRHGTPFEAVVFQYHIKCPIFVAREWMRHRIGSFNEYSGRYSEMPPEFYVPADGYVRTQKGKPGSYKFEQIDNSTSDFFREQLNASSKDAYISYLNALRMGVAKEQARFFLPVNWYTMFSWTVNFRALMNFVSLRSAENAMWEIRQYSLAIEHMLKDDLPLAYQAFKANGNVAP